MTIRQYFILAVERPYAPEAGKEIVYTVELDSSHGRHRRALPTQEPITLELPLHLTFVEGSWGPNTSRIEGFMRNPRTQKANRALGHHRTQPATQGERIGLLQVYEDD